MNSYLIVEAKNGILLNFTGDISSPVYLPSRPMLCDKQPAVGNNECNHSGCQRKALSKTCNYCCTRCIAQYDCQPNGVPCEAHIASNERRIQRNHDLELDNVQRSTESKSGPKKGRTKQVTSSKASVLSVSRKRKRSYPATSDVADQPDSSPPKLAIMVRQAPVHADPRVRVRPVHVYPRGSVVLTSVTLGKKVSQPNMLLHV